VIKVMINEVNNVCTVGALHFLCKGALFLLDVKLVIPQSSKHSPQVFHMILQGLAINDNVIKDKQQRSNQEKEQVHCL